MATKITKKNINMDEAAQRMQWATAAQHLVGCINKLLDSREKFEALTEESLEAVETRREVAKAALQSELQDIALEKKRRLQELEMEMADCSRIKALDILQKTGEVPIAVTALQSLQAQVVTLEKERDAVVAAAVDAVRKQLLAASRSEIERTNMTNEGEMIKLTEKNKSETAVLTAQNESLRQQMADKDNTILNLREDVQRAQQLVQSVAEASRPQVFTSGDEGGVTRKRSRLD